MRKECVTGACHALTPTKMGSSAQTQRMRGGSIQRRAPSSLPPPALPVPADGHVPPPRAPQWGGPHSTNHKRAPTKRQAVAAPHRHSPSPPPAFQRGRSHLLPTPPPHPSAHSTLETCGSRGVSVVHPPTPPLQRLHGCERKTRPLLAKVHHFMQRIRRNDLHLVLWAEWTKVGIHQYSNTCEACNALNDMPEAGWNGRGMIHNRCRAEGKPQCLFSQHADASIPTTVSRLTVRVAEHNG